MLRIGVVAALVGGGLAVTATPALADPPTVTITRLSPNTLNAGQSADLRYQVNNSSGGLGNNNRQVDLRVNISGNGLSCSGACGSRETIDNQDNFNATLRASNNLPPGSNQTVTISITASNNDGTSQAATVQVTLKGPDAPQTVKSISGKVVNSSSGRGISDATVAINDSGGHNYTTQTDNDGEFKFTSSDNDPISPGKILIGAGKEGFQNNKISTNVSAGQSKSGLRLTLRSTASPTASATEASPTAEESLAETLPSDQASAEDSIDPAIAGNNQGSDSGGGLFSWVLIILGGLLVALGVGAIVLLVIRRKEGGEDDTGDPLPGPNGPRPTPGAQGVFRGGADPTMVAGGAGMGANPTMAMRPGLAEAPTMMHKPVDEYGDPYGTPLRAPQPTSGAPGYGYQGANQGGYGPGGSPTAPMAPGSPGAPTAYGSASPSAYGSASPAGYGNGAPTGYGGAASGPPDPYAPRDYAPPASQGGYGYDEPTGRYDRNAGYGAPDQGGPRPPAGPAGGYDADPGYGQSTNGYGGGNGYGRQDGGYGPGADNGYEPAPRGGYDGGGRYQESPPPGYGQQDGYDGYGQQQGGYPPYEQGGYDQQSGYDRAQEPRQGGYDQQRGYDQGYYEEPSSRGERPSRRSLDWLDD